MSSAIMHVYVDTFVANSSHSNPNLTKLAANDLTKTKHTSDISIGIVAWEGRFLLALELIHSSHSSRTPGSQWRVGFEEVNDALGDRVGFTFQSAAYIHEDPTSWANPCVIMEQGCLEVDQHAKHLSRTVNAICVLLYVIH